MVELGRVITAMVTPFTDDDKVDYARAQELALALLDTGTESLVLCGSTGEGINLSKDEKLTLVREVKDAVGSRAAVIANTGNYSTWASIELASAAARAGADVNLLTVPYYNKPPQEGLRAHFSALCEAAEIPCMIYNVPSRTVTDIAAETVVALSHQWPTLVGIKESSGSFDKASKILAEARPGFRLWSGDDNITLPLMSIGAYGVVSVVSHLVGRQISGMVEAFLAGRLEEAAATHRRVLPLVKGMFLTSNPMPLKYALKAVGMDVGTCRLPLVTVDDATRLALDELLSKHTIDLVSRAAHTSS